MGLGTTSTSVGCNTYMYPDLCLCCQQAICMYILHTKAIATSCILMGLYKTSKYYVIDSTKLSSLWQKCYTVNIHVHVPGPVLVLPVAAATTSTGSELAPSAPSCMPLDTLPMLVLRSKLLLVERRGESWTPCSEYSSDLSR